VKTLHLTNAWAETSGGIATFYRALIAESNRRNHQIRLVVPAKEEKVENVGDYGKIYHVRAPNAPLNSTYRTIYPSQFLLPGSRIQEILACERPDLIEISDKYTLHYLGAMLRMRLIAALEYRPILVGLSQERMDDNVRAYFGSTPFAQPLSSAYMKWVYFPFFDHHIANSEYTAGELRAVANGHLIPRGTWIRPMGVELDYLSPARRSTEHRRRLFQNFGIDDGVLLLYAGRLVPEKNLRLLFDVLFRLEKNGGHDYRLLLVGDGIEREAWERECESVATGRAFFMGYVRDQNILADIYANADIFIHPNPREPFGIAPLEAMASGVPLVAPNVGGVTSYANNENAWTVNPDVDSFEAAIKEVVADPVLAARRVRRALVTAGEYRWDRVAASFLELYKELYRQPRAAGQINGSSFYSTPAGNLRAGMIRGMARVAVEGFRLWSKFASPKSKTQDGLITRPGDLFPSQGPTENDDLAA
jgi:alpha-1,6-mannosyltransferase